MAFDLARAALDHTRTGKLLLALKWPVVYYSAIHVGRKERGTLPPSCMTQYDDISSAHRWLQLRFVEVVGNKIQCRSHPGLTVPLVPYLYTFRYREKIIYSNAYSTVFQMKQLCSKIRSSIF